MPSAFLFSLWSVLFVLIPILVAASAAVRTKPPGRWIEHTVERASIGRGLNAAFYFCSWVSWWVLPRKSTISSPRVALAVVAFSIVALALYLFLSRPERRHALPAFAVVGLVDVTCLALIYAWVGSGREFTVTYRSLVLSVPFVAGAVGLVAVRLTTRVVETAER